MNYPRLVPFLAALALLSAGCQSSAPMPASFDAKDGRVTVTFADPEKYTDAHVIRDLSDTKPVTEAIEKCVQSEVRRYLRAGETFKITFTDIDLAGDFEPARRPGMDDVRILKPIYPPRLAFTYVLAGAGGKVLAEGHETLTDLSYQTASTFNTQRDPFFYEKELLRKWVQQQLQPKT